MISLLLSSILAVTSSAQTTGCTGPANLLPIVTQEPVYLRETTNGKLYYIDGNGVIEPRVFVAHLYGTPYDMGYAYGALLKTETLSLLNDTFEWLYSQMNEYIDFLPPDLRQIIEVDGIDAVLDYVYDMALPFIPDRYIEEMHGLADATGASYDEVKRVTMIPEAIKAQCSMVGAWGNASSVDSSLVQLRALDWNTNGPFQQFPVFLVYHPTEGGHPFGVLSWSGLVGAITGYADADVGICEKVWLTYDGKDKRDGTPFTFVLRDILQFDETREAAIERINSAHRTCSIFVGVGDSHTLEFNAIEYSVDNVTVYSDTDFPVYENHPRIPNVVYIDKHEQPSHDPCLGNVLSQNTGSISAEFLFQQAAAQLETGDMHIAVYDYKNRFVYISNAAPYNKTGDYKLAYQRPFIRLNATALFNLPPP